MYSDINTVQVQNLTVKIIILLIQLDFNIKVCKATVTQDVWEMFLIS
jgi:hypothetical protein